MAANRGEQSSAPFSNVEPPFGQEQVARGVQIAELMAIMGRRKERRVFYTSLPACNSEG